MKRLWWFAFLCVLGVSTCLAQFDALTPKTFELNHYLSADGVTPGGSFRVALLWKIPRGYYLYRDQISVKPLSPGSFASFDVAVPQGVEHRDEVTPQPSQVFFDELKVIVTCTVRADVQPGEFKPTIEVGWQGCGAGMCFRPETRTIELPLKVVARPDQIKPLNEEIFPKLSPPASQTPEPAQPLQARSVAFVTLLALVGGIATSLTPCVFPLIPIIIAVVGIEPGKTGRLKGLGLSSVYVAGIVLVYAVLGGVAGFLGETVIIDPRTAWVRLLGALVLVLLAAAMFGLYDIQLPSWLTSRLSRRPSGGILGAFLAGVASALLATTCVAAPLLAALGYAATTQSVSTGMLLGGSFALGMGLLLIVVGAFAGLVQRLASGQWMVTVKQAMGMVLVGSAIYFLQPILPDAVWKFSLTGFLLVAGILALTRRTASWVLKALAVLLLLTAGTLGTLTVQQHLRSGAIALPPGETINWMTSVDEGLALAGREGKPAIIDFWANWCELCKVMDFTVFRNPEVVAETRNFVMIRADISRRSSQTDELEKHFGVMGPPTVVFVSPDGTSRTVPGQESKTEFLNNLRSMR